MVRPEGLYHWKILMTPLGIEPATCWFLAYCLNHYTTARPTNKIVVTKLSIAVTPDVAWMIVFVFTSDNSSPVQSSVLAAEWTEPQAQFVTMEYYIAAIFDIAMGLNCCLWFGLFSDILWWPVILLEFVALWLLAVVEIQPGILWIYILNGIP
jgi:hypothetical protein